MPLYEYRCPDCGKRFDALRTMSQADAPVICPECGEMRASRAISLFAAIGITGTIAGAGSSCGSYSAESCAGCALRSVQ